MTKRVRRLLRKLPRNSQRGFTLIELLVVISILGILAAVVTMSMVGITNVAEQRAEAAELHTVQVAMDAMAADQLVDSTQVCANAPGHANDMTSFPSTAHALAPRYLHQAQTKWFYTCDPKTGVVSQSTS